MASTTKIYNNKRIVKSSRLHPVAAATNIHAGNMIIINTTSGMASAGASAASSRCVGRAGNTVLNGSGSAGDLSVIALQEPATFDVSGTSAVGIGDIGLTVYIEDPQTIAKTIGSNAVAAGVLIGFDGTKAIVDQSGL